MVLRALTLHQPWATLVALGLKRFETRDWETWVRGPLVIHAGKRITRDGEVAFDWLQRRGVELGADRLGDLPLGALVGTVEVVYCYQTEFLRGRGRHIFEANVADSALESFLGDYSAGRFAWLLEAPRALRLPIPCRGYQNVWRVPGELLAALKAAA